MASEGFVARLTQGISQDVVAFVKEVIQSRLLYAGLAGIITSRLIFIVNKDFYFYFIPEKGDAQTYMAAIFIALLTGFWYLVLSVYAFTRQNEDPYILGAIAEVYALSVIIWIMATYQANVAEWKWWQMMLAGNTQSITVGIFIMFGIAMLLALVNLGMAQRDNANLNRLSRNLQAIEAQGLLSSAAGRSGAADRFVKCEECGLRYDGVRHSKCPKCGAAPSSVSGDPVTEKILEGVGRGLVRKRVEFFLALIREGKPLDRDSITAADAMRYSLRASFSKYFMGLLTLTGLFGTFIGLMFSLEGIQGVVDTLNNFTDVTRLQTTMTQTVKGLQTAFGTSIAGLACGMPGGLYLLIITNLQAKFYARMEDYTTIHLMPFLTTLKERVDAERAGAGEPDGRATAQSAEEDLAAIDAELGARSEPAPKPVSPPAARPAPRPVQPRADRNEAQPVSKPAPVKARTDTYPELKQGPSSAASARPVAKPPSGEGSVPGRGNPGGGKDVL